MRQWKEKKCMLGTVIEKFNLVQNKDLHAHEKLMKKGAVTRHLEGVEESFKF